MTLTVHFNADFSTFQVLSNHMLAIILAGTGLAII